MPLVKVSVLAWIDNLEVMWWTDNFGCSLKKQVSSAMTLPQLVLSLLRCPRRPPTGTRPARGDRSQLLRQEARACVCGRVWVGARGGERGRGLGGGSHGPQPRSAHHRSSPPSSPPSPLSPPRSSRLWVTRCRRAQPRRPAPPHAQPGTRRLFSNHPLRFSPAKPAGERCLGSTRQDQPLFSVFKRP